MKRALPRVLRAWLFCSLVVVAPAGFIWTGVGNGWKNQAPPPNDGTADLVFGENVSTFIPILSPAFSIYSAAFVSDNRFLFVPQSGASDLNLGAGGISISDPSGGSSELDFNFGIAVNLAATQVWDFGNGGGTVIIHGMLGGSGSLTLTGSSNYTASALLLANPVANTNSGYSGNLTLGNSTVANFMPTLAVWASGNLGTGSLTFVNGGQLITHNATSLANDLFLNTGPLPGGNNNGVFTPVSFKAWDAPLVLSGSVTLGNHTTINAQAANPNLPSQLPGNTGSWVLAGPRTRHPVIFTGHIGESSAGTSLNITGPGLVILAGNNTLNAYSGGTNVGFLTGTSFSQQGTLVFASHNAIPSVGTLQSGLLNTAGASGYIGVADTAVSGTGIFNNFLTAFAQGSSGAVGIDSLDGANAPDATPHVFSDAINLSWFNTSAGGGIRLGTATSIILTGNITPQLNNTYSFGNGGGRMFVQSNLADLAGGATSVVNFGSGAFPLRLYLRGANTYTNGTGANLGIVVFDGANSIPATGQLLADGSSTNVGASYIGYTENAGINGGSLIGSSPGDFLAKFAPAGTWGIIGFDTTSLGAPAVVANLNLAAFNDGVFIGTNSAAILSGTLTPTGVTNGNQTANTLRFTAASGGTLTVNSTLADNPAALRVVLGSPAGTPAFSDGTVILNGTNTYTGGTLVNNHGNLSLVAGSNSAFGSGDINLQPHGGVLALSAGAAGVNLANAIIFGQAGPGNGYTSTLSLTGGNDFILSGNLSGPDRSAINTPNDVGQGVIALNNASPVNVTVAGNNGNFHGTFLVQNGTMTFTTDNAPGHAQIEMPGSAGTVSFLSLNPVVYGLWNGGGGGATVNLGSSTNLTVNTTDNGQDYDWEFGGSLVGAGTSSLTLTGTINPSAGTEFFYLYGTSPSFSGDVYINGQAALALGQNDSVGTGTITLSATDGGIALNTGVTLTNPLIFNSGALAGIGTFAPSGIGGIGQTAGQITLGANQFVYPGIPGDNTIPGELTLATNVAFADGGSFALAVQDPAAAGGYGTLYVTGGLDLNAISTAGFTFKLESLDLNGNTGISPAIVPGTPYSLLVVTASGGVSYFDAADFTVDASKFQDGLIPDNAFTFTADSNHLYLNFVAVPEPSAWALLAAGAGLLGLAAWRRRRA